MRRLFVAFLAVVVVASVSASAGAAPPDRSEEFVGTDFPDFGNGVVVFVNTTRDAVCTDEQIEFESDFLDWVVEYGDAFFMYLEQNNGDPTDFPGPFPPPAPPALRGDCGGSRRSCSRRGRR